MGVLNRQFCVDMIGGMGIYLFFVGLRYDACAGEVLFSAADLPWVCEQYFVIVSYSEVLRDDTCVYVAHVCFMFAVVTVQGSVHGDVCGISGIIERCVFH